MKRWAALLISIALLCAPAGAHTARAGVFSVSSDGRSLLARSDAHVRMLVHLPVRHALSRALSCTSCLTTGLRVSPNARWLLIDELYPVPRGRVHADVSEWTLLVSTNAAKIFDIRTALLRCGVRETPIVAAWQAGKPETLALVLQGGARTSVDLGRCRPSP